MQKPVIGIRPGEKIHEEMITVADSVTTYDLGNYYVILPSDGRVQQTYMDNGLALTPVANGFSYDSSTNPAFLSVLQLRSLISKHVDPSFQPV